MTLITVAQFIINSKLNLNTCNCFHVKYYNICFMRITSAGLCFLLTPRGCQATRTQKDKDLVLMQLLSQAYCWYAAKIVSIGFSSLLLFH